MRSFPGVRTTGAGPLRARRIGRVTATSTWGPSRDARLPKWCTAHRTSFTWGRYPRVFRCFTAAITRRAATRATSSRARKPTTCGTSRRRAGRGRVPSRIRTGGRRSVERNGAPRRSARTTSAANGSRISPAHLTTRSFALPAGAGDRRTNSVETEPVTTASSRTASRAATLRRSCAIDERLVVWTSRDGLHAATRSTFSRVTTAPRPPRPRPARSRCLRS